MFSVGKINKRTKKRTVTHTKHTKTPTSQRRCEKTGWYKQTFSYDMKEEGEAFL